MILNIDSVNLQRLKPDKFFIDTNVLYWFFYSRASLTSRSYQTTKYPQFIAQLISLQTELITTIYNVSELLSLIERKEADIYNLKNGTSLKVKDLRKNQQHRENLKNEFESILTQIKSMIKIECFSYSENEIKSFVDNFCLHTCDFFDFLCYEFLKSRNIKNIITDDSDFASIDDINIFTANQSLTANI